MKHSRAELKMMARRALKGNYSLVAVSMLLFMLLSVVLLAAIYVVMLVMIIADFSAIVIIMACILGLAGFLVVSAGTILLAGGYLRICYNICIYGKAEFNDLLYTFRNHPLRYLGVPVMVTLMSGVAMIPGSVIMFLAEITRSYGLSVLLGIVGTILMYVPGFIVSLRYGMAVVILIENPDCRVIEALKQSRYLTRGKVLYLFVMSISFLGWWLLGYCSAGIGFLWITPYMTCTMIFCYQSLKQEKYNMSNQM